ncbi:MAG: M15 family metallopeptidase [Lutispora sp.]|nr:M15 family metallopeptidase [Lutispora sp.]MDD4833821.1 M15 family metallopeptidase [Lutispora sp.]
MKKIAGGILILSLVFMAAHISINLQYSKAFTSPGLKNSKIKMKQDLLCLMMAYSEYITDIECADNGMVYLVMKSGKRIVYDDKRVKSIEVKIANPDLQDMMEQIYPLAPVKNLMDANFDPGRSRVYGLLEEVYGKSRQQVESNLTNVKAVYNSFQFNGNNQAAESLQAVMQELIPLMEKRPDIRTCVLPCSGTYNYRYISDTNRLSPHAFGIAIDLARDNRDYWKWASREEGQNRLASYPEELVDIFERNNFIWGGKWGHFDILHFEYRPEIILMARYFGDSHNSEELWYKGVPLEETSIKSYIKKIDLILK